MKFGIAWKIGSSGLVQAALNSHKEWGAGSMAKGQEFFYQYLELVSNNLIVEFV